jgi:hypothetical protein
MKTIWRSGILCFTLFCAAPFGAADLLVSIGIRETGGTGPIGSDGGTNGGIEFVNLDGQTLVADGTWQLFTFTPATDPLTAFAGSTANGVLDTEWGVLEQIRFRNTADGATAYRLWIDNLSNRSSIESGTIDFEGFPVGAEVVFQEPGFSGSTAANLNTANLNFAGVDDSMAFAGTQSYLVEFEFIDDDPSRWVRLTTFNAANLPNPAVKLSDPSGQHPTISFYARLETVEAIPDSTASMALLLFAVAALVFLRHWQ